MTSIEPQPAATPSSAPPFQFSLRTLLLLFVVLGSSLGVFGAGGVVVFAVVVGLAIYVHQIKSLSSLAHLVLAVLCMMCLIGLLLPPVGGSGPGRRAQCDNKLHQIALALQNYHQVNGCFPPAYIADKHGKPMLSWRVLILPYMDADALYKMYDLTEPWDGPKNKKLSATHLRDFVCPSDSSADAPNAAQTSYVAVVGQNAAWAGAKPRKLADFPAGPSRVIMLVEIANSGISWAEPRDLSLDALGVADGKSTVPAVSSNHGHYADFFFTYDRRAGVNVAMADGSTYYVPSGGLSAANLRKILPIGGCKLEEIESYEDNNVRLERPNWPNIAAVAVWLLSVGALLTRAVRSRKTLSAPPTLLAS